MPACLPVAVRLTPLGRRKDRPQLHRISSREMGSFSVTSMASVESPLWLDMSFRAIAPGCELVTWRTKRAESELCRPEEFARVILCVRCECQESEDDRGLRKRRHAIASTKCRAKGEV